MPSRRRLPLSRDQAIAVAVTIADADGLEALTMRRLASELRVEAMSLYHHVANKEDILDGMVDLVFGEIDLPPVDADWKTAMLVRTRSARAALTRHRWALGIVESRRSPGQAVLRHHDAVLGACRAAGFTVEMSAHAFALIDSFLYGFVLQELNLAMTGDDLPALVDEILPASSADEYPHLTELTVEHILGVGYSFENEFEFGLGLILDSLERAA